MLDRLKSILESPEGHRAMPASMRRHRRHLTGRMDLVYVIADIHGCYDELRDAERRIAADISKSPEATGVVVMLGDYVDRGPRSSDTVAHLLGGGVAGLPRLCLCGNHDEMMVRFMADPEKSMDWLDLGGDVTLASYGVDVSAALRRGGARALGAAARDRVPRAHVAFLTRLPVMLRHGKIVFVHAGVRPGIDLDDQTDEDLMWIREPFLSEGPGPDHMVVHGHTVTVQPEAGPNRLGLDTGAYVSGRLTVLRLAPSGSRFI
jgi:serine/threonine protein phosphatase 1